MGYGYVRDSQPTQINWADIGKQMTDAISAEVKDREGRKEAIDTASSKYAKDLLDQPQGSNAEVNRFMADFSNDAMEQARQDLADLKSGRIKERDYYRKRANLDQGTALMFQAGKGFNANYDKAMERAQTMKSSKREIYLRSQMEGFMNFSGTGAYINPLTAEVNVAKRDSDGNLSSNPNDFSNVSELLRLSTAEYDRYDVNKAVKDVVDNLGDVSFTDAFGKKVKMPLNEVYGTKERREQMNKAKEDMITSILANEDNTSSILADSMLGYNFTRDKNEAAKNDKLILIEPDGSVNFESVNGKKQMEAARQYVDGLFESSLDIEVSEANRLDREYKRYLMSRPNQDTEDVSYEELATIQNRFIDAIDFSGIDLGVEEEVVKLKSKLSKYIDIEETAFFGDEIKGKVTWKDDDLTLDLRDSMFKGRGDKRYDEESIKAAIKEYLKPKNKEELIAYMLRYKPDLKESNQPVDYTQF